MSQVKNGFINPMGDQTKDSRVPKKPGDINLVDFGDHTYSFFGSNYKPSLAL